MPTLSQSISHPLPSNPVSLSTDSLPPKILGILLVYYESYLDRALAEFSSLLRALDSRYTLLVVCNNEALQHAVVFPDAVVLAGDNRLQEFSGWQVGLDYARREGLLPESGIVVFANDTLCHHNRLGPLSQWAFRRVFRRVLAAPLHPAIAGDVHHGLSSYAVAGRPSSRWISTYLFAINSAMLREHPTLLEPAFDMSQCVTDSLDPDAFVSQAHLSPTLRRLITDCLFPRPGKGGWHGRAALTLETRPRLASKVRAIVAEMNLSATVVGLHGCLHAAFGNPVVAWMRKLERQPKFHPRQSLPGVSDAP